MNKKIPFISRPLFNAALLKLNEGPQSNYSFQKTFNITEDVSRELCWRLIDSRKVEITRDWKLVLRKSS